MGWPVSVWAVALAEAPQEGSAMSKTKNRLYALIALLIAGGALAFIATRNMSSNLVYYWSPSELRQHGAAAQGSRPATSAIALTPSLARRATRRISTSKPSSRRSSAAPIDP